MASRRVWGAETVISNITFQTSLKVLVSFPVHKINGEAGSLAALKWYNSEGYGLEDGIHYKKSSPGINFHARVV